LKPSTLLRPQTAIKKINRKPNEINGLAGHPYASARSPTVTFDNENKSTPKPVVLRRRGSAILSRRTPANPRPSATGERDAAYAPDDR
jgi:hypothetical protein